MRENMFTVTQVGSWPRSRDLLRALRAKQKGELSHAEFDQVEYYMDQVSQIKNVDSATGMIRRRGTMSQPASLKRITKGMAIAASAAKLHIDLHHPG